MTDPTTDQSALREQLLNAIDFSYCQTLGFGTPETLLAAYDADRTPAVDRAALRDRIADVLHPLMMDTLPKVIAAARAREAADAALAVLPATTDQTTDLETARATNQRLNREKQQLESELATYRRAVAQWEINERGTYIPHSSLRTIGLASGKDILGSVRHLKHFERVEQAEAANERLRAELRRVADETAATSDVGAEFVQQTDQPDEAGLAAWERDLADETAATETTAPHRPVSLATPCTVCGHPYNWHTRRHGQCEFAPAGQSSCGCTGFVPGKRPEPMDPRRILGVDPDFAAAPQPATLSPTERTMLGYALDQAQERIWSEDGFTDEDQAAVDSLRRLATAGPAAGARQDGVATVPCVECDHPKSAHGEGEDPVSPGQCQACPDDDAWHDYRAATERQDGVQR